MAVIEPFRGFRFVDPGGDPAACAAPPYDVIDDDERDGFAARSPANVVHLTLPRAVEGLDRYATAARLLDEWIADGRLVRDEAPSFHLQDAVFPGPDGAPLRRPGLIGLVEAKPIGEGPMRGHEEVQAKPVEDRYNLLRATRANLEPIWVLYRDAAGAVDELLAPARAAAADATATLDEATFEFRRADASVSAAIREHLDGTPLYIADGHHRFTVASRFHAEHPDDAGAAYRMALLVRAEDPGVVVLPTHRFVDDLPAEAAAALATRLEADFDLIPTDEASILADLARADAPGTIGVARRRDGAWHLAVPRAPVKARLAATSPAPLHTLDVVVLHRHLLDPETLGHALRCRYVRGEDDPLGLARSEDVPLALLLRPPTIATILEVSDRGLRMPSKSTYFSPKAASGQVLHRFDDPSLLG
ncbi:MAG: DUF1015 family protein [Planctomycetota bacterium JB042]